jgi:hypothetical protein
MASLCGPEVFGANPVNLQWSVVRGDTSSIRVEFLEDDEKTYYDTADWEFAATTYDFAGDILDELEISSSFGYVDIIAPAEITEFWGEGFKSIVTELAFDLEVTLPDETVWTPVVGTIRVIGDVTGSL